MYWPRVRGNNKIYRKKKSIKFESCKSVMCKKDQLKRVSFVLLTLLSLKLLKNYEAKIQTKTSLQLPS